MPFQVIFSAYAEPPGKIVYFDAGDDQIIICSPTATLTATVVGDLTGHTFLWEQVSGTSVTFTSPTNELEVQYSQTTFDNKTFKFTIDKGTPFAQVDYINVFGSPTEILDINPVMFHQDFSGDILLKALCNFPTTPLPSAPSSSITCPDPILIWEVNTTATVVEQKLYENSGSGWNYVTNIPPDALQYETVNVGSSYKIEVTVNDNLRLHAIESNTVYFPTNPSDNSMNRVTNTTTDNMLVPLTQIESISEQSYSVDIVTLKTYQVPTPEEMTASPNMLLNSVSHVAYSAELFTLKTYQVPTPEEMTSSINLLPESGIQEISYSVTDLSGGDIGG